jgi:hypothetical protein
MDMGMDGPPFTGDLKLVSLSSWDKSSNAVFALGVEVGIIPVALMNGDVGVPEFALRLSLL